MFQYNQQIQIHLNNNIISIHFSYRSNKMGGLTIFVVVSLLSHIVNAANLNVFQFGAKGDGIIDDSKAFLAAWGSACSSAGASVILIPAGRTFLLGPTSFSGPCKSSQIQFALEGAIVAPNSFNGWTGSSRCYEVSWIYFGDVQGLQFIGSGTIDGRGPLWWRKNIPPGMGCGKAPVALRFHNCNGLQVKGTTHLNGPFFHIVIEGSNNVNLSQLKILAPFDSPNTDGIDIYQSSHVVIRDSVIGTGDDCIAIKGGSHFVNITNVHCGPGHGISIGSLGEHGANDVVDFVYVARCTFNGSTNGARIKTWQGGAGHVSAVLYEDITVVNAGYPIIIDQKYTGFEDDALGDGTGVVQVSGVIFRGFRGTSATKEAIMLRCSEQLPCTGLTLENIDITSAKAGQPVVSYCANAHGVLVPPVIPSTTCLLP